MLKYGNSAQTPWKFFKIILQRALNDFPILLQTQIIPIFVFFGPKCPNMEIRPRPLYFWKFENYPIVRMVSSIRFQRAFNDFPILLQTQIIPIFVF